MASAPTPFRILSTEPAAASAPAKPPWLRVRFFGGPNFQELKQIMRTLDLHTVCESARCPNMGECWEHRTATFMILGNICTRACGFCAVPSGRPLGPPAEDEPERVAEAVEAMGLRYAVVTSVNRDDQADGGAHIFARTIAAIRRRVPGCRVEVLVPDFRGAWPALEQVIAAAPDVLNHNIETVPRLSRRVRSAARYERSLELLGRSSGAGMTTKSGMMLGLGETGDEVLGSMRDLADRGVSILTLGQYLQPTREHLPVARYVRPEEFAEYKREGLGMGFRHVESGPLVRSSYHAFEQEQAARTSVRQ
ncbi:MAG TPA: lipoyl synthase [Candidatus Acidoferrales bacterium]|nr:lipoyl synthase [Candidatus Acidoferrales bacterium]